MKQVFLLGTAIWGCNVGAFHTVVAVVEDNSLLHLSNADSQVISSLITVLGSFGIAFFMHILNIRNRDNKGFIERLEGREFKERQDIRLIDERKTENISKLLPPVIHTALEEEERE